MYNNGFIKVQAVTPKIITGDIDHNKNAVINILNNSKSGLIVFPELTLTGYAMSDLFFQNNTLKQALLALDDIIKNNNHKGLAAIGMPLEIGNMIFNVAVVLSGNNILGVIPKYYLPNNYEYSEKRWFESGFKCEDNKITILNQTVPFGHVLFKDEAKGITVGIEICQDMWQINPPSNNLSLNGANVILNLSASSEIANKNKLRKQIVLENSRRQMSAYIYTTSGMYESSGEFLFTSQKIIASLGVLVKEDDNINYEASSLIADININEINFKRRQDTNYRSYSIKNNDKIEVVKINFNNDANYLIEPGFNDTPFYLDDTNLKRVYNILSASLVKKLASLPINNQKVILGLSGGLDSAHALIIANEAIKRLGLPMSALIPVIMPADASSEASIVDAIELASKLELKYHLINIDDEVKLHLKLINHNQLDTTYENVQARIRTLVLMNYANKYGGIVLGTGDMSEIALGFMTYNGDQMSMYAINSGLPKTTIQQLIAYYANNSHDYAKDVLMRILNKKISPELLKNQVTEDLIGSYKINDFILYEHLHAGLEEQELTWLVRQVFNLSAEESSKYVKRFLVRFYNQTFKRQTMPEGPKIFSVSLSPRSNFQLASDVVRK